MAKIVLKISMEPELRDKIVAAAKGKYVSVSSWITSAAVDALPKPSTAKPVSVREEKAMAYDAARKAKLQGMFREQLANGETPASILAGCSTWRQEAAQWLAEVQREPSAHLLGWHDTDNENPE